MCVREDVYLCGVRVCQCVPYVWVYIRVCVMSVCLY